ncbi:MAG: ligase-associated DNA damage response endonuclease PdeM [Sphingobacteriales bacterium]|nr:ligase-associated DNA damage response endonuclease PdeM [Sphingobacteriales bacterium]
MTPPVKVELRANVFWLSPEKAVFWEDQNALIISDLHFAKTGHFRKSGIAVPQSVYKKDLQRLFHLVQFFKPMQLLIVGDMFHSEENKEMDLFKRWRGDIATTAVKLIKGNHDILNNRWYDDLQIELYPDELQINEFIFTHHPVENNNAYVFSGHIHPGVRINGSGKQSLRFPCFYFTPTQAILPAFGGFTGFVAVDPSKDDKVFAIVNNTVLAL